VWVATDRAVRGYVPVLFGDGRVAAYATRRQTLDSRLLIAFVLSGPVAAGLMAAIAYIKAIDILTNPAQGYFHLQSMVGMMFLALGGAFLVALVFRQILTHDLLETVREVKSALGRLERGEQGVHVPVRGADELGLLAEQANALARQLGKGLPVDGAELATDPLSGAMAAAERQAEPTLAPPLP
jgi:methyl-accepting chemotaxis protein